MTRNAFYLPALAAIGLGLLALLTGHFHRGLMPVAENLPGKTFLCYTVGIALLFNGAGIFLRKIRLQAALSLSALYFILFLLIHLLKLAREISNPNEWTAATEMLQLSAGAFFIARLSLPGNASLQNILNANKGYVLARWIFGMGMFVFAILHFKYAAFIATLIPAWIPLHYAFTIAIGIGFAAAGISCLLNLKLAWAGYTLGAMFLLWVLVLHLPRVLGKPGEETEWTSLLVALAMTGASFTLARLPMHQRKVEHEQFTLQANSPEEID